MVYLVLRDHPAKGLANAAIETDFRVRKTLSIIIINIRNVNMIMTYEFLIYWLKVKQPSPQFERKWKRNTKNS